MNFGKIGKIENKGGIVNFGEIHGNVVSGINSAYSEKEGNDKDTREKLHKELIDGIKEESENKTFTIKIFLASSSDLKEDRDAFDLYFRQQNDRFLKEGIYLEIIRWENFLDKMSETRLQNEYNKEVRACDIFVSLFFSKAGKYTEEEFDTAHQQFLETKKPLIYTFFKNAPMNLGDIGDEIISLLNFKKKLSSLGHFYSSYDNIEHLKRQFNDQLEKLKGMAV